VSDCCLTPTQQYVSYLRICDIL